MPQNCSGAVNQLAPADLISFLNAIPDGRFRRLLKSKPAAGEWRKGFEWMRGQQKRTGPLFSYISTEDRIPAIHPLRQVRRLADQVLVG
jgi:hypothetical protein